MSLKLGDNTISDILKSSGGTGGTTDYTDLENKPSINGVELIGNKTSSDLGITANSLNVYTKNEVDSKITNATNNLVSQDYLNTQLSLKADTTYVSNQLLTKADINDVYTKEEIPSIIQSNTANKTDKSYVDNNLALKADKSTTYTKTEVDSAIDVATSGIDTKLATKANVSDVYTKTDTDEKISEAISGKADTAYVNTQLALKADKSDTYTKKEIDEKLDNPTITGDTLPIGSVVEWTGTQTPQGWLLCDGREVSRTTYSELFAAIGTVWGAGDGSTSFNIPDYRDKFVLGAGGNVDLAETGGESKVKLNLNEVPPHYHYLNNNGNDDTRLTMNAVLTGGNNYNVYMDSSSSTENGPYILTSYSGGGQAHNNMPPYVGTYYIIKAKQSAGVVATVVDNLSSTSPTNALSANQGKILNDKLTPTVLYYDVNGTNNNISLSDAVSNYTYIEIYAMRGDITTSVKIDSANNKHTALQVPLAYKSGDNEHFYIFSVRLNLTENLINFVDSHAIHFMDNSIVSIGTDNSLLVYKVLGYKY